MSVVTAFAQTGEHTDTLIPHSVRSYSCAIRPPFKQPMSRGLANPLYATATL
ncbi:hypothetical protein [uncultured Amphritea sp.]|uniref:hypothetical protein n=1 Tax=uncultured Amphritea sp. TaxID=981605 RepID=UPI00262D7170|nr:hypothetical protein [uncultured Amphritea sp.]